MIVGKKQYKTVWMKEHEVQLINQPLLPHHFEVYSCKDHNETAQAIQTMIVRGAGAIGAAAGYAMAQAAQEAPMDSLIEFKTYIEQAARTVKATRPTAYDLFYAVDTVVRAITKGLHGDANEQKAMEYARHVARTTAEQLAKENEEACAQIGEHGAALIKDGMRILTHCNAGWLAFVDWGSAIAPIYQAHRQGKKVTVFVDETRPRCQGARLTAWELANEQIPHYVIADNAAGHYMQKGEIDMVIVGADRIAGNGDVANKIGTYTKAVLAKAHNIPFYVAAPSSTFDSNCANGKDIVVEERSPDEVLSMFGKLDSGQAGSIRIAPTASSAKNPAFDVTPAELITGIITEKGINQ